MLFEIITEYHWYQYNYGGPHFKNILQDVCHVVYILLNSACELSSKFHVSHSSRFNFIELMIIILIMMLILIIYFSTERL